METAAPAAAGVFTDDQMTHLYGGHVREEAAAAEKDRVVAPNHQFVDAFAAAPVPWSGLCAVPRLKDRKSPGPDGGHCLLERDPRWPG